MSRSFKTQWRAWAVVGLIAATTGCGASVSTLPHSPHLVGLSEAQAFEKAPPPAWPEVELVEPADAAIGLVCGVSPALDDGIAYAAVSVSGRDVAQELPPINVSLVLDRSGSMRGDPFRNMLLAAEAFVHQLRDGDRVSIVVFSRNVYEAVAPIVVSAQNREAIVAAIRDLGHGGSTFLSGGYLAGIWEIFEHYEPWALNQVVLLSDGQPTDGITSTEELVSLAAQAAERGVGTTTVGFGRSHDELLMMGLADAGGGTYYYVGSAGDIPAIFEREAGAILRTAARSTWALIDLPPATELLDVIGWDYILLDGGKQLMLLFGSIPAGEERYATLKLRRTAGATETSLATTVSYADVWHHGYRGLQCSPTIGARGGRDTWTLELAGRAEAAWGLAEAMSWADGDRDPYAIAQIGYTRGRIQRMQALLPAGALSREQAMLAAAQTRLGLRIADGATRSLMQGGIGGLARYGMQQSARAAEAAAVNEFAPRIRIGVPVELYGFSGTRFYSQAGRIFQSHEGDKGATYKQARYDAYVQMRIRVDVH